MSRLLLVGKPLDVLMEEVLPCTRHASSNGHHCHYILCQHHGKKMGEHMGDCVE